MQYRKVGFAGSLYHPETWRDKWRNHLQKELSEEMEIMTLGWDMQSVCYASAEEDAGEEIVFLQVFNWGFLFALNPTRSSSTNMLWWMSVGTTGRATGNASAHLYGGGVSKCIAFLIELLWEFE